MRHETSDQYSLVSQWCGSEYHDMGQGDLRSSCGPHHALHTNCIVKYDMLFVTDLICMARLAVELRAEM